jgi:uncharacterized membrane protein
MPSVLSAKPRAMRDVFPTFLESLAGSVVSKLLLTHLRFPPEPFLVLDE